MLYPAFDFGGGGVNRIDIDDVEAQAHLFAEIVEVTGADDPDFHRQLIDGIDFAAQLKLRDQMCGVVGNSCVGFTKPEQIGGHVMSEEYSSFVGLFMKVSTVLTETSESLVPALVFDTVVPDDLPPSFRREYDGIAGYYPFVAVPLVGNTVMLEKVLIAPELE